MSRSLSLLLEVSLVGALFVPACGGGSGARAIDTGVDSPAVDASADADASDAASPANCAVALSGTAPFGKALSGTGIFAANVGTRPSIESTFTAFVYFPNGRVPGGKVLLAMRSRVSPTQYFFGSATTLASDLSATGLVVRGHDVQIAGALLPGADGLRAVVSANFSDPGTDVADQRTATLGLCPDGDVPDPTMKVFPGLFSPLSRLGLYPATPIAVDELNKLRISTPLGNVPFTASKSTADMIMASGPTYVIVGKPAFPPGQALILDESQIKDVLGRSVTISLDQARVLATTATVSDLTFSTPPAQGAVASAGCVSSALAPMDGGVIPSWLSCTGGGTVADGVLTVRGQSLDRGVVALVALPDSTGTVVRVRMAVGDSVDAGATCLNGHTYAYGTAVVAVVGATGEATEVKRIACGGGMLDHLFTLPSTTPRWLVVAVEAEAPIPYSLPPMGPPAVRIDELAFQ